MHLIHFLNLFLPFSVFLKVGKRKLLGRFSIILSFCSLRHKTIKGKEKFALTKTGKGKGKTINIVGGGMEKKSGKIYPPGGEAKWNNMLFCLFFLFYFFVPLFFPSLLYGYNITPPLLHLSYTHPSRGIVMYLNGPLLVFAHFLFLT